MKRFFAYCGAALTFLIVFTVNNNVFAGTLSNWELALEHDSSGNVIQGSYETLKTAIENGADVKVAHIADCGSSPLMHSNILERVNIDTSTNIINGNTSFHAVWTPNLRVIYQISYYTNGQRREAIYRDSTETVTENYYSCAVKWFVNK